MKTHHTSACLILVAILAAGCGGGSSAGSGNCSLGSAAGCGGTLPPPPPPTSGGNDPPPPVDPAASVETVSLVASSSELPSSGLPGTEVTVTALLKSASNVAVGGAKVDFSSDSGFLAVTSATSDASGKVTAILSTGGSQQNRPIKVTARAGSKAGDVIVNVTGTHFAFAAPSFVPLGSTTSVLATLLDSADRPIAGQPVTASGTGGGSVSLGASTTDSRGQVPVRISAATRGPGEVTVSALGASATRAISVTGSDVALLPAVTVGAGGSELLQEVKVGACAPVDGAIASGAGGSVTLSTSRGELYSDAACTQALSGPVGFSGASFRRAWIKSDNVGVASIDAIVSNGARGSTRLEFVASLSATARVNVQPDLAVVGSGERSTLIAVVRDGTPANNLVKGATVQFSILADPSGGTLLSPFSSVTGSDGVARAVFQAGPADGGKDGTVIQARIVDVPSATGTANLTVNKKALSIQFGTGNKLIVHSLAVLQQDFAVFVSDSAGNPVRDVTISAAAWPVSYWKGELKWKPMVKDTLSPGMWAAEYSAQCMNEDVQRRGLFDSAFDRNGNRMLDPGIPLNVSSSGKTDALGLATVSLRYPADRAYWVSVELTVTGTVSGTESVARNTFLLTGVAGDYNEVTVQPPGRLSPFGLAASCATTH